MHRLTIAFAALALLFAACSSTERDAGVDLAATPTSAPPIVATPAKTPTAAPTPPLPVARLGQRFTLRFGESVSIGNAVATLTFDQVVQDSRCPTDVTCIRAGDVTLRLATANADGVTMVELTIGDRGEPAASFDGLRVTLLEVAPIPRSTGTIDPLSYSARLIVEVNAP